jgi:hypothetical protein
LWQKKSPKMWPKPFLAKLIRNFYRGTSSLKIE